MCILLPLSSHLVLSLIMSCLLSYLLSYLSHLSLLVLSPILSYPLLILSSLLFCLLSCLVLSPTSPCLVSSLVFPLIPNPHPPSSIPHPPFRPPFPISCLILILYPPAPILYLSTSCLPPPVRSCPSSNIQYPISDLCPLSPFAALNHCAQFPLTGIHIAHQPSIMPTLFR